MDGFGFPSVFKRMGFAAEQQSAGAAGRAAPPDIGSVEIREVISRGDLDCFVELPRSIYADDPHWVPRLNVEVKEFLDPRKHPFYLHGAAAKYLAIRDGRAVGRILVSDDPNYNRVHEANVGRFGMFECVADQTVAHALLNAAAAWLRARGRTQIFGPIDYSTNYPIGLLIDGFDTPPRFMMNHNPPFYAGLLESWGLVKEKDMFAWWFDDPQDMVLKWKARAERLAERGNLVIRPFRRADFDAEVRRCNEVYATGMEKNWGFVPLSAAEFGWFAKDINRVADEHMVLVAEYRGEPVGFSVTLPDINEAIRPLNGRLTTFGLPIGLVRLLWRIRRVKTARMLVLVVKEGYRRRGVAESLILRTLDYGKNVLGYTRAELSWTLEDNLAISRVIEAVGGRRYKTYRVYQRPLD